MIIYFGRCLMGLPLRPRISNILLRNTCDVAINQ
jgi:hypothetical protein